MRYRLLAAFFLVTLVPRLFASQKDRDREAAELRDRAKELSDIRTPVSPPFRLRVRFKIMKQDGSVADGVYTEFWVSTTQWRKELVVESFRRTQVAMGRKMWTLDTGTTEPAGLNDITTLVSPMAWPSGTWKAEKIQDRALNGMALRCLKAKAVWGAISESCFDRKTGTLALLVSPFSNNTHSYRDYQQFGDRIVPTSYENRENDKIRSQARLEELMFHPEFDQASFNPPAGAKESGHCPGGAQPPVVVRRIEPAPFRKGDETVTVLVKIDQNGAVRDLKILKSVDKDYDQAALEAVGAWKFKPATCEGEPFQVQIAIELESHFH